jgi:hypothetical protein
MTLHRAPKRQWAIVMGLAAALALISGAAVALRPASAAATLDPIAVAQAQLANCQLLAAKTTGAQHDRAAHCVEDQTDIIALLSPHSTPSATVATPPTAAPPTAPPPNTTTTTPPTDQKGCLVKPSACGFPDGTNTGVAAGTKLAIVNGSYVVSQAGAVVDGQEIHGCVEVRAANVTIRNTRILGNDCFYAVRNFSTGLRLENDEITCGGSGGTGVTSDNYTVVKSNVYGCENGFNVHSNVVVQDSWIHNLYYGPGAHTDGAQFNQGGGPITFSHNTIIAPDSGNSAIIMWDEADPQNHDVLISNNILANGGFTLYCPRTASSNVKIVNNRFGEFGYGQVNGCTGGQVAQFSGNVNDADSSVVRAA